MGKLTHPSQGQELESAGRIPDQTENSISSKKCEKSVLCDGDIYYCGTFPFPILFLMPLVQDSGSSAQSL